MNQTNKMIILSIPGYDGYPCFENTEEVQVFLKKNYNKEYSIQQIDHILDNNLDF